MTDMKVILKGATRNYSSVDSMTRFGQTCARTCYSERDFDELELEPRNDSLLERVERGGHHSVHGHMTLNFYLNGVPKALAMVLNNEQDYNTSEKSARFTQMKDITEEQKELYDKWIGLLIPRIERNYPPMKDPAKRVEAVRKLAQENARYVTSVFTPTKMVYTVDLRQLNFLLHEFDRFIEEHYQGKCLFKHRLADAMIDFSEQHDVKKYIIASLKNQTDRHLSFFADKIVEEHFGDTYSTSYLMSFAGLGQAQRHRTISYGVVDGYQFGSPLGFFVPAIVHSDGNLQDEWIFDLTSVALDDFPQAQFLRVNEMGTMKNFRSKAILRLCGHAQYEIMRQTKMTGEKYAQNVPSIQEWLSPKCVQGLGCAESCVWGGKGALERIV